MSNDDAKELSEFGQSVFGTGTLPLWFYEVVRSETTDADAVLGQVASGHDPVVYWLRGDVLGILSCRGEGAANAEISGSITRLSDPVAVKVKVVREYDRVDREVLWWSRIVSLRFSVGDDITIDPTRGFGEKSRLAGEAFIDKLLAMIGGGPRDE